MVKIKNILSAVKNQNSLDLNVLIRVLWRLKIYFFAVIVLSLIIGIISFFIQNKEYESKSELLLESSNRGNLGQLGNLANMAGVNLSAPSEDNIQIDPNLYEKIIHSHSFIFDLIHHQFFSTLFEKEVSLEEFFILDRYNGELPESFKKIPPSEDQSNGSGIFNIMDEKENELREYNSFQNFAIGELKSRISVLVEDQLLTLLVKMPEPEISTRLNILVVNNLKDFLIAYKTEKLSRNVQFVKERKNEAEKKYREAQKTLAQFRDQNQGVISQMVQSNEENLQSELNLSFNILNSLSQNLEQSQIRLKREMPVFFYIEKPVVPRNHSEPKFILYFFIYLGLGIVICGIILFGLLVYIYLNKMNRVYGGMNF
ncbi:MAG: Wzz/FepE/Etk N-terminal domain-containing protein [Cyclobacteriaceae bacterium]